MLNLQECLKCLHDNYAILFPGIDTRLAQQASVTLVKAGVAPIPMDYILFLSQSNGLSWSGVELFSLNNIERNKGSFYHPGILKNYQFSQNNPLMKKKLLLGYGWETILVYDAQNKEYQLMDRYTYDIIFHFRQIIDFLNYVIRPIQKQMPTGLNE